LPISNALSEFLKDSKPLALEVRNLNTCSQVTVTDLWPIKSRDRHATAFVRSQTCRLVNLKGLLPRSKNIVAMLAISFKGSVQVKVELNDASWTVFFSLVYEEDAKSWQKECFSERCWWDPFRGRRAGRTPTGPGCTSAAETSFKCDTWEGRGPKTCLQHSKNFR